MKIFSIENDYINFLYKHLKKENFPIKTGGFNMSFIPINDKEELYIIRYVVPLKSVIEGKKNIIPGVSTSLYESLNSIFLNNNNISDDFIWDWENNIEDNILFVGSLTDGKIKINKNILPATYNNQYTYKVFIKQNYLSIKNYCADYRLINIKKKIFIMDSGINIIREVKVLNNKIEVTNHFIHKICTYSDINKINHNVNRYYKVYEKNWSLYQTYFNENGLNLLFLHNFVSDGILSVNANKVKCTKKYIVKYKKDPIPFNHEYFSFSFGSTLIEIEKNKFLGIGHSKISYKYDNVPIEYQRIYDETIAIHKKLKTKYKTKFKPHSRKMYFIYFFILDINKDAKKRFTFSDSFLPEILFDDKYIFSVVFPMSIVKKGDLYWFSMGYGDYTNLLVSFTLDEVKEKIIHNAEYFDINKYNFILGL